MATPKSTNGNDDAGQAEVQERFDVEQEQGFRGIKADPTPNENYTLAGVTTGKPTPETTRGELTPDRSIRWAGTQKADDATDATDGAK